MVGSHTHTHTHTYSNTVPSEIQENIPQLDKESQAVLDNIGTIQTFFCPVVLTCHHSLGLNEDGWG